MSLSRLACLAAISLLAGCQTLPGHPASSYPVADAAFFQTLYDARQKERAAESQNWQQTKDGAAQTLYPEQNGCVAGTQQVITLKTGTRLDRYSVKELGGSFLAPLGMPFPQRAMPPASANDPLRVFEVRQPFQVQQCVIVPWFNQPGGGIQYFTRHFRNMGVKELVEGGYLAACRVEGTVVRCP